MPHRDNEVTTECRGAARGGAGKGGSLAMPRTAMSPAILDLETAAARIPSGATVSIGGFTCQRHPTALLRAMIRRGVDHLGIYCHSAGSDVDLLVGAGAVDWVEGAYLADGVFSPVAPAFRRRVEAGELPVGDWSNAAMVARFRAAATGLPWLPIRSMLASDLLGDDALEPLRGEDRRLVAPKVVVQRCPWSGDPLVLVPAARTDFCLLHVQRASVSGLVQIDGQEFADVEQALAAEHVIVTCEELVEDEFLRRDPERNRIPPFAIDSIVPVRWGSHPHGVHRYYDLDADHLRLYSEAARSEEGFRRYLGRFVLEPADHGEYLELVGGEARLAELRAAAEAI